MTNKIARRGKGKTQMSFETIRSNERAASINTPAVSFYGRTSQFRLNAALMDALGNPDAVEVQYDAETSRVALVPSDAAYAVRLREESKANKTPGRMFGMKALATRAGLDGDSKFTVPAEVDNSIATFSLGEVTPVPIRARKSKAGDPAPMVAE